MWVAMRQLPHHAGQKGIIDPKTKTLHIEIVQHIAWQHVLQDSRLAPDGGRDVFTNGREQFQIHIIWVTIYRIS